MAKRKRSYRRSTKNFLTSKTAIDGYMSAGGKIIIRKILGGGAVYEAGVDVLLGAFRKNNTLLAQGIINGLTAFLPSFNLGGGVNGGVR